MPCYSELPPSQVLSMIRSVEATVLNRKQRDIMYVPVRRRAGLRLHHRKSKSFARSQYKVCKSCHTDFLSDRNQTGWVNFIYEFNEGVADNIMDQTDPNL